MSFPERLRQARRARGLTLRELAKAMNTRPATISQLERGRNAATSDTLLKLARTLGVSIDWLLGTWDDWDPGEVKEPEGQGNEQKAAAAPEA